MFLFKPFAEALREGELAQVGTQNPTGWDLGTDLLLGRLCLPRGAIRALPAVSVKLSLALNLHLRSLGAIVV